MFLSVLDAPGGKLPNITAAHLELAGDLIANGTPLRVALEAATAVHTPRAGPGRVTVSSNAPSLTSSAG